MRIHKKNELAVRVALAVIIGAGTAAMSSCGSGKQQAAVPHEAGTVRMALVATTNGHTYRLRQALFRVEGPRSVVLDSDAQPDATTLTATLDVGSYTVTLVPGWFLERMSAGGAAARVEATLTSPNPAPVEITANATATVAFSFATDGVVVTIGQGSVAISVDVTENGGAGQISLLAGNLGSSGSGDGVGANARFNFPVGVTSDGAGNLFVADTGNNTIRKIVLATGEVTTFAGQAGARGSADGTGSAARFASPLGMAADGMGNLYVADNESFAVRRIALATAEVTTFAGGNGPGSADGPRLSASFASVVALAFDDGNLYVADQGNSTIRRIALATGDVTTFAGSTGLFGVEDGTGTAARFDAPAGLATDGVGNLYVSDGGSGTIRKVVLATAAVTTFAGTPGVSGSQDGTGPAAQFSSVGGLTSDGAGNLYVADVFTGTIRKIVLATAQVTTLAGNPAQRGHVDGTGSGASFDFPRAVASDGTGNLYVADSDNSLVRKVVIATGQVTTFAGLAATFGNRDARGAAALFGGIDDTFSDGAGNLYVADGVNNTIRKIVVATGQVTTIAGAAGLTGSNDGRGTAARFNGPSGLAGDGAGNLYVADTFGNTIRKVVLATGDVSTLAGTPGLRGSADGVGTAAQFATPQGLAADGAGNLYVGDSGNVDVRKVVIATGEVTTFAGSPGGFGDADGVGAAASFQSPRALTSDGAGNLFVADGFANTIRKIVIATAAVTTIAGSAGQPGSADGTGAAARFNFPGDIIADAAGNLYVGDDGNHTIRKISAATGAVTTVAGVVGVSGVVLGALPARLSFPASFSVLPDGGVVFADEGAVLIARF